MSFIKNAAVVSALVAVSAAQAGTLKGIYTTAFNKQAQFETTFAGHLDQGTVQWNGARTGGTDTTIANAFVAYCVELGEFINPGNEVTQNVYPLLGSTTNAGGLSGPVNFNATRTKNLETLWGTFFTSVGDKNTSAAFQMAVWEIAFDDDLSLTNSGGHMFGTDRDIATAGIQLDPVSQQAQSWLSQIASGAATQRQSLALLSGQGVQDLITPVPEPATLVAIGLGIAAIASRKKRN